LGAKRFAKRTQMEAGDWRKARRAVSSFDKLRMRGEGAPKAAVTRYLVFRAKPDPGMASPLAKLITRSSFGIFSGISAAESGRPLPP
jgi:hypothetical protein